MIAHGFHEWNSNPVVQQLNSDHDLQVLLRHIAVEPFTTVTAKYLACGFSRRRGNMLRQKLETLGLIMSVKIKTTRGITTLLELTHIARDWLKKNRAKITPLNGGIRHAYWQHDCKRLLESHGWNVKLEWIPDNSNHAFDIAAWKDNRRLLLEIESGKSNWQLNAQMLLKHASHHPLILWIGDLYPPRNHQLHKLPVQIIRPAELNRWVLGNQLDKTSESNMIHQEVTED